MLRYFFITPDQETLYIKMFIKPYQGRVYFLAIPLQVPWTARLSLPYNAFFPSHRLIRSANAPMPPPE
jgi:hypothetical protein